MSMAVADLEQGLVIGRSFWRLSREDITVLNLDQVDLIGKIGGLRLFECRDRPAEEINRRCPVGDLPLASIFFAPLIRRKVSSGP